MGFNPCLKLTIFILSLILPLKVLAFDLAVVTFDKIEEDQKGNFLLHFTYKPQKQNAVQSQVVLYDDDGAAALATTYYMLIQASSNNLKEQRTSWEILKTQNVVGWDNAKYAVLAFILKAALSRVREFNKLNSAGPKLLETIYGGKNITYQELHDLVGIWLKDNVQHHVYKNTQKDTQGNSGTVSFETQPVFDDPREDVNPIGRALFSRNFDLPNPNFPGWSPTIQGDLEEILKAFQPKKEK